ncbi:MAG: nicotinamide-nucleotide amidohydrolase family protein, partial [Gammaproteobacteria bacterium]|nr:nicotinamide-nucleotide amidohydrolase family protein [Gammaproteobacteria bacterium]
MYNSLIKRLIKDNISISFAESCTGGALVSALTKIAGVSKILEGSFITYSNEFKVKELGVKEETINEFGVVSAEVAHEMVEGLYNKTNAKLCISTTGNAGPTKGDLTKDLGDVYVGIMY